MILKKAKDYLLGKQFYITVQEYGVNLEDAMVALDMIVLEKEIEADEEWLKHYAIVKAYEDVRWTRNKIKQKKKELSELIENQVTVN